MSMCACVCVEEPVSGQDTVGESKVEGLEKKETETSHLESNE